MPRRSTHGGDPEAKRVSAGSGELARLACLLGVWKTEGWVLERADSPGARIDATDTYEWIPGRWGVLHRVDARVGDEVVEGAEIIGYDPERRTFVSQYFGSDGPTTYAARFGGDGGALTWEMESANTRFRGVFNESRDFIDGHWTLLEDGEWRPWMEITLTRVKE